MKSEKDRNGGEIEISKTNKSNKEKKDCNKER
jgi:hypothetical protein